MKGTAMDPLTSALKAAGAIAVDPGEFRTPDENTRLLRPLVDRGVQVWELLNRLARERKRRHNWRWGVHLRPYASGLHSQMVADSDTAPPSIRKAGFREVVEVLRCPGEVGYPPGVATDAQLGFSAMAYQPAEMLFGRREEGGYISVRLQGTCARAHQGGQKGDMTQRAKAGYRPCCTRPTHVAAPSRYMAGEYSGRKAHGIQLRKEHGPWAVCYFAATVYVRGNGCLPSDWDWAAQYLTLEPPTLFDGNFGAELPGNTVLPAPASRTTPTVPPNPRFFCRTLPLMLKEIFPTAVVVIQSGAAPRIIPPSPLRRLPRPAFPSPAVDVEMKHPKGPVIRRRRMNPIRISRRFGQPTAPILRRILHSLGRCGALAGNRPT